MVGFGGKQAWLAVRDGDPGEVLAALGLRDLGEVRWRDGIDLAHLTDDRVAVTPPLPGVADSRWVLAAGRHLLRPDVVLDLAALSKQLHTEIQFFATHRVTETHRWQRADDGSGPFSVFPLVKHAHRTSGFFKVRGINVNHADFEDFMFRNADINDFKAELVSKHDLDVLLLSVEVRRGIDAGTAVALLKTTVREQFELTPQIVVVETGSLAREFEASVKMPRFADRRL